MSVIIPVHNGATYLRAAIESVLNQSGIGTLELIVVDDGSTDDSANIAESYRDKLTLIRSGHHGVSHARNLGIENARCQYLQFLDADDLLLPDALAKRIARLRTCGASVCMSHWHRLSEIQPGKFVRQEQPFISWLKHGSEPVVAMVNSYWCPPAAWTMRRTHRTRKLRFNESLSLVEDVRFLIDAGLDGASFTEINNCLALYRVTQSVSLSRSSPRKFCEGVAFNSLHVDLVWRQSSGIDMHRRKALINAYDYASRSLYRQNPKLFLQVMNNMLRLAPFSLSWPAVVMRLSPLVGYMRAGKIADSIAACLQMARSHSSREDSRANSVVISAQ